MTIPLAIILQSTFFHDLVKGLLVKRLVCEEAIVDLDEPISHLPNLVSDLGIDTRFVEEDFRAI